MQASTSFHKKPIIPEIKFKDSFSLDPEVLSDTETSETKKIAVARTSRIKPHPWKKPQDTVHSTATTKPSKLPPPLLNQASKQSVMSFDLPPEAPPSKASSYKTPAPPTAFVKSSKKPTAFIQSKMVDTVDPAKMQKLQSHLEILREVQKEASPEQVIFTQSKKEEPLKVAEPTIVEKEEESKKESDFIEPQKDKEVKSTTTESKPRRISKDSKKKSSITSFKISDSDIYPAATLNEPNSPVVTKRTSVPLVKLDASPRKSVIKVPKEIVSDERKAIDIPPKLKFPTKAAVMRRQAQEEHAAIVDFLQDAPSEQVTLLVKFIVRASSHHF